MNRGPADAEIRSFFVSPPPLMRRTRTRQVDGPTRTLVQTVSVNFRCFTLEFYTADYGIRASELTPLCGLVGTEEIRLVPTTSSELIDNTRVFHFGHIKTNFGENIEGNFSLRDRCIQLDSACYRRNACTPYSTAP